MNTLRICLLALTLALLPACGASITEPEAETPAGPTSDGPRMSGVYAGSGS